MPIYEYECEACGHSLDALQKLSDAHLKDCPACGRPALRKRVSAPRFRLKGAGWYETDFKPGNRRNLAEAGDAGEKKKDEGAKKSDDAKSAPKEGAASADKTEKKAKDSSAGTGKSTASSDG